MANTLYDIKEEIVKSKKETSNPAQYFERELLGRCRDELHVLYPGKLYVLDYFPKFKNSAKPLYDSHPYIMSLGPSKNNETHFYGINMHIMPYMIREQVFEFIYDTFSTWIDREIKNYPLPEDSYRQKYIKEINTSLITNSPFQINIGCSIHKYNLKYIRYSKTVNYNLLHYMLQSETNYFVNGTINDAQEQFMKQIKKH